ncbi:hypothetical protein FMJ32_00380 [Klebsiella michiganensis]|nr:hypothetical protein [Klebsiella michiganensis]
MLCIQGDLAESLKARHCSHCFQYYFSQPGAGFFLLFFQPAPEDATAPLRQYALPLSLSFLPRYL